MTRSLGSLLDDAVARGVITAAQRESLLALDAEGAPGEAARAEAPRGFSGVNVAYGIGALLVLFAFGWFLVTKWAALGPWGVLGVALLYAAILVVAGRQLTRIDFPRAGGLAYTLAVALTPLVAWSVMTLGGEWPNDAPNGPLFRYQPWMATRNLVLELSTILVALLVWRKRRFPALVLPLAVALWAVWLHLTQLVDLDRGGKYWGQWTMLAAGFTLLAIADGVERWQQRTGVKEREGDYAGLLWYVGLAATGFAYLVIWLDADEWKHLMPFVAMGFLVLSIVLRRRGFVVAGVLGVFGYLAWLASDVFKTGAMFPIVLAALGILTIFATVWLQRRLPSLARRMGGEGGVPPWSPVMAWVPVFFAVAMALLVLPDARELKEQAAFRERLHLLRMHAGSIRGPDGRRQAMDGRR